MMTVAQVFLLTVAATLIAVGGTVGFAVWQFGWPT